MLALALGASAAVLNGCNAVTDAKLAPTIVIAQTALVMLRGEQQQLQVTVHSAGGGDVATPALYFSSTAPKVASVTATGTVVAAGAGVANIVIISGDAKGTVTVTVTDPDGAIPVDMQLAVSSLSLWPGDAITVPAVVNNKWVEQLPLSVVTWVSSAPGVAAVSPEGVVRGVAAGSAVITATSGTLSRTIAVTVQDFTLLTMLGTDRLIPGAEAPMSVVKFDSLTRQARAVAATWVSSNPSVVSISADGVATGVRSGEAIVTATLGNVSATSKIVVAPLAGTIAYRLQQGQVSFLPLDGSAPVPAPSGVVATGAVALSRDGTQLSYDCGPGVCIGELVSGTQRLLINKGSDPSWTSDGKSIAVRTDYSAMGIVPVGAGTVRTVLPSHYVMRPRISADGAWLAFQCDFINPYDTLSDLCIQSQTGAREVLYHADAYDVAFSPRGDSLAFVTNSTLCIASLHTPGCSNDPLRSCVLNVAEPAWSPDGSYLVVLRFGFVWITNPAGTTCMRLKQAFSGSQAAATPTWGNGRGPGQ